MARGAVDAGAALIRLAEATLTIGFAYAIYIICDHYLHVSGVVAVAAAALAVSGEGRRRLAPSNFESLVTTWKQPAFWASSLIFLFRRCAPRNCWCMRRGAIWRCLAR